MLYKLFSKNDLHYILYVSAIADLFDFILFP